MVKKLGSLLLFCKLTFWKTLRNSEENKCNRVSQFLIIESIFSKPAALLKHDSIASVTMWDFAKFFRSIRTNISLVKIVLFVSVSLWSFSTYTKFPEKLTFLTHFLTFLNISSHVCVSGCLSGDKFWKTFVGFARKILRVY